MTQTQLGVIAAADPVNTTRRVADLDDQVMHMPIRRTVVQGVAEQSHRTADQGDAQFDEPSQGQADGGDTDGSVGGMPMRLVPSV